MVVVTAGHTSSHVVQDFEGNRVCLASYETEKHFVMTGSQFRSEQYAITSRHVQFSRQSIPDIILY